ncbi:hydroxyisourate hydrolase [Paracoccus jiaweipingae]|uniref:hydroxyisourate hydrolase n=1 Tax=unclassified Paracoccus (in: a-proteobacteria) TaxID=2688777 RepID=UPI0037909454
MNPSLTAGLAGLTLLLAQTAQSETISTHILDLARGVGGADVPVTLALKGGDGEWHQLAAARTDENGRVKEFAGVDAEAGIYRLSFDMTGYGDAGTSPFFPQIDVTFQIRDPDQHHHVPVVVSPFGYSTYRGN